MTIEQIIKQTIEEYKLFNSKSRREEVERLLNYYTGTNTEEYVKHYFALDAFSDLPPYKINITRKFIDKMSRVYNLAPKRKLTSNQERYLELTRNKNIKMKHVEKMTNLLGTIALQISFEEKDGKNILEHRPVYYFDAHFTEIDPYNPIAITYPTLIPTGDIDYSEPMIFEYWDASVHLKYDTDGNILMEEPNPYGVLPFIFPREMEQIDDFICEGATDIANINEQVNITLFNTQYGLHLQMVGQMFATGVYADQPIQRVGPDTIINLPEGGTFGIATPKGNFRDAIEFIKFQMELAAQSRHMHVTFDSSADRPSSGVALKIKDFEHISDYRDDIEKFRVLEHDIYKLERVIADYNGIALPETFSIEYEELDYPLGVQEQIQKEQFELSQGFVISAELLQKRKGDITIQEAEDIISKNSEEVVTIEGTESPTRSA